MAARRRGKKKSGRSYAWRYRGRIVACVFVEVIIICALVIMIGWNKGVKEWFARINAYGAAHGIRILHYINSSGMKEIIEGTQIAHEFRKIYACSFLYDVDGIAYWPAVAVNYTNKTQFICKINKGVESVFDSKMVNRYIPENERLRGRRYDRHPLHAAGEKFRRTFDRGLQPRPEGCPQGDGLADP